MNHISIYVYLIILLTLTAWAYVTWKGLLMSVTIRIGISAKGIQIQPYGRAYVMLLMSIIIVVHADKSTITRWNGVKLSSNLIIWLKVAKIDASVAKLNFIRSIERSFSSFFFVVSVWILVDVQSSESAWELQSMNANTQFH